VLPIAEPLYRHWCEIAGDNPKGPLFPRAFSLRRRNTSTSGALSNQFYEILTAAGLVEKRSHHKKAKGRNARRAAAGLGFHCLRHTATTLLKANGVSDAVTREIVGHESAAGFTRLFAHRWISFPRGTQQTASSSLNGTVRALSIALARLE
jgi:integrase